MAKKKAKRGQSKRAYEKEEEELDTELPVDFDQPKSKGKNKRKEVQLAPVTEEMQVESRSIKEGPKGHETVVQIEGDGREDEVPHPTQQPPHPTPSTTILAMQDIVEDKLEEEKRVTEGKGKEKDEDEDEDEDEAEDDKKKKPQRKKDKKKEKKDKLALKRKEILDVASAVLKSEKKNEWFERLDDNRWKISKGFAPNMKTEAVFYANDALSEAILEELSDATASGFVPAVKQLANVAGLPGIVGYSLGMPDIHSGYGFAIGNVAAIDMDDPQGVVSPGGVGFDINCGVRLLRTNISETDAQKIKDKLAQTVYDHIPVGVGSKGDHKYSNQELDHILGFGMEYLLEKGMIWPEDITHCEEGGRMKNADPKKVSARAKDRGRSQTGTLGSGNHYVEIQVVDHIFDDKAAEVMGLKKGNICVMIHSGSRGLGHQLCTDYLQSMAKSKAKCMVNDRQLTGVRINSEQGKDYLDGMAAAANYAFVNRSLMMMQAREAFEEVFKKSARDLDMHVIYDVAHNIAKFEKHIVDGKEKNVLVHRKGATRAFAPHHPEIPAAYKEIGQPVLIGGSMGTFSYVLTGTQGAMEQTFGSTCHGAGRALSRSAAMRELRSQTVMKELASKGITLKVASPKLIAEEAPESYKNIDDVVHTCHNAGISKLCVRLRPIAVIKG
eukprot:TRINITY_DN2824_c0_g1_i1.p1 TRINITY_DN2824_c0_g1~~TRINITY_DN2824_c0_g1_i1.p1  ORF type:complete len:667 (+),score=178.86 TRINITY_DN2824_c0_g1_i1:181-2181(+)